MEGRRDGGKEDGGMEKYSSLERWLDGPAGSPKACLSAWRGGLHLGRSLFLQAFFGRRFLFRNLVDFGRFLEAKMEAKFYLFKVFFRCFFSESF